MSTARANTHTDAIPSGLHAKLVWVRSQIGTIDRDKQNDHLRYRYRTEETIYAAVRPLLDRANLMLYVSASDTRIEEGLFIVRMDYTIVDADSAEAFTVQAMGAGDATAKNGPDSSGLKKAQTGAARYFFQKCFLIADGTDDEEDHGKPHTERPRQMPAPRPVAAEKPPEKTDARRAREMDLKDLAVKAGVPLKTALEKAGKSALADLSDGELQAWISKMRKKIEEGTGAARVSDREAADLRSALTERGLDAAAELKRHGIASGLPEDCTVAAFNALMSELY